MAYASTCLEGQIVIGFMVGVGMGVKWKDQGTSIHVESNLDQPRCAAA